MKKITNKDVEFYPTISAFSILIKGNIELYLNLDEDTITVPTVIFNKLCKEFNEFQAANSFGKTTLEIQDLDSFNFPGTFIKIERFQHNEPRLEGSLKIIHTTS